jgi:hypothetical protein
MRHCIVNTAQLCSQLSSVNHAVDVTTPAEYFRSTADILSVCVCVCGEGGGRPRTSPVIDDDDDDDDGEVLL